jgi:hypothetical protein
LESLELSVLKKILSNERKRQMTRTSDKNPVLFFSFRPIALLRGRANLLTPAAMIFTDFEPAANSLSVSEIEKTVSVSAGYS